MYEKTTLKNGLRVLTATMPHTRSVSVQVYVGAGARNEEPEIAGVSHFVEHMVFKGTRRRPAAVQISEEIEGVGGALNATTDHEHTNYRALVPSDHFETAFDVLTDMLRGSTFAPREIRKERAVIVEEINATYDSPADIVDLAFDELIWTGHPLGRDVAGTRKSVRQLKRDDLLQHVRRYYTPQSLVISVAGNVTHETVVAAAEARWGDLEASVNRADDEQAAPTVVPGPRVRVYFKETEQTNLVLGVPALPYTHPDRYAQEVLDALLGGGMSSRLFAHVREDLGLAYSVSSFVRTYADAGAFGVYAAVDNERVDETLQAILAELVRISREPVGAQELRKVKEYIKGHTLLSLERTGYVAQWSGWQELVLGRIESVDDALARIEAVTAEDLLRLSAELFSEPKLHLALVGPFRSSSHFKSLLRLH